VDKIKRQILANQFRIFQQLGIIFEEMNLANELPYQTDWSRSIEALENGYVSEYEDLDGLIFGDRFSEELPSEECAEVSNIISMYWYLQRNFDSQNGETDLEQRDIEFPGFDGNNETRLMRYAEFILSDPSKFDGFLLREDSINSHHSYLSAYRDQLSVWEDLDNQYNLDIEEIERIVEAMNN
jgi:uncharacterized protein YfbU (UPF0304 family)